MSENIFVRRIGAKGEARIREWIKALVSGKYQQTNGKLKGIIYGVHETSPAYCCLGVICQINNPDGWGVTKHGQEGHEMGVDNAPNGYLNAKAARRYNLSTAGQKKLAKLNDNGYSFTDIALFIAEQLGAKLAAQA